MRISIDADWREGNSGGPYGTAFVLDIDTDTLVNLLDEAALRYLITFVGPKIVQPKGQEPMYCYTIEGEYQDQVVAAMWAHRVQGFLEGFVEAMV